MIFFLSCSSLENNQYKILKSYLKDENRVKRFKKICYSDSIIIPDTIIINTLILSNRTLKRYIFWENNDYQKDATVWIDSKEKFILSEKELRYIESQLLELDNNKKWDDKKLTFNNFKALNDIKLKNNLIGKNRIIYHFSEPIMGLDNNYSFFYSECSLNTLESQYDLKSGYVIMKKVNNKWIFVGELYENRIID